MKIYSITNPLFAEYGRVTEGISAENLLKKLDESVPMPDGRFVYQAEDESISSSPEGRELAEALFGGMPAQIGYSIGFNSRLDALEYHRDSEFSISTEDYVVLVARRSEIVNGTIDSGCVKAFLIPAHLTVEIYATTLHYAPCNADPAKGFKMLVFLPAGTNKPYRTESDQSAENVMLLARNKWVIAHKDSPEAAGGAYVGITGENIDLAKTGMEFE